MSEENQSGMLSCPVICWIIGALIGLASYMVLSGRFGMSAIVAIIIALVVMAALAWALSRLFCSNVPAASHYAHSTGSPKAEVESAEAVARVSEAGADTGAMAAPVTAAAVLPDTAATSRDLEGEAAAAPAETPAAKPAPAKKPAAKKPAAKKPAAKKAPANKPAEKAADKPARKPVAKDGKPEMMSKPRAGGADDLKQIKGVGPKLEKLLNSMGVYHFDQVAGWRKKEVEWVDENLEGFKGRVSRDEWVKQAKVLAKGGTTEFSNRVKKGDVY